MSLELDEAFHTGVDPYWRESAWYHFAVPERGLVGFFYYFYDLHTGAPGGGPAVWDSSGEEIYDCRFYDWRWLQPNTPRLDGRDFTLPNSLRHQVLEPMQHYRLSYAALGFQLELEWKALMKPHEIRYDAKSIASGSRHFDQPGRCVGWIVLDGERIAIDCFGLRDRTWGPHRPGATRAGDYMWAIASKDSHWHAITGADERLGSQQVLNGYLYRDGRLGDLVTGERRVLERRGDAPSRIALVAADEHGRELRAEGSTHSVLRWMGWPGRLTYWTLTHWRWNGEQGFGENQEFFPLSQIRVLRGVRRPRPFD